LIDWRNALYSKADVNECYNLFITTITKLFENCFPLTRQSRRACKDKKWITKGLKVSSKHKERLYKIWLSTRNALDEARYYSYKRIYSKLVNKAEILYYDKQFDMKINSMKKIWSNLNRVCSASKSKKCDTVINKLNVGG
jgi:hypothetical protein